MCGIAGIVSRIPINTEVLVRMNNAMKHRGPDGEGFVLLTDNESFPLAGDDTPNDHSNRDLPFSPKAHIREKAAQFNIGLAHRRLAIIDLDATGHQPMCDASSGVWITFNGEIYNYLELRTELSALGHRFITQSDTEVILAAYRQWGKNCLQHFNGMWAFVIIDRAENRMFAARDRFGVKPFYFVAKPGSIAFASEQKVLLASNIIQPEVNRKAVFDYFVFGQIEYEREGFLKGIEELHAGYFFESSLNNPRPEIHQWYKLPVTHSHEVMDEKKHIERISELLDDAIRIRLRADVDVGSCLSGGLDSSAIVGFMRKNLGNKPLHVFTASFPGSPVDEGNWASLMAQHVQAIEHTVTPTADELRKDISELMYAQDVPIWSTSTYAQFRVMRLVQQTGIRVVLDGQGGDEVFAGYQTHNYFRSRGMSWIERLKNMNSQGNLGEELRFFLKQYLRFEGVHKLPNSLSKHIYSNYFNDLEYISKDLFEENSTTFRAQRKYQTQNLNDRLALEMQNTSLKAYLKCEDRCAMWHSVESRTPFADDHPLIEYVFNLPESMKIKNNSLKHLLREASSNVLPEKIKNRHDKQGYTTPNSKWISEIADSLYDSFDNSLSQYLNIDKIRGDFDRIFKKKTLNDDGRTFKLISFALWIKQLDNYHNPK
jgi:asparagine synthase (glutamine-hydrolysing)